MKIKEVEEKTGLSRANIRLYERRGLLAPSRENNNYRDYTEQDVERLRKIMLFRKMDFSIDDIHALFHRDADLGQMAEKARERLEAQRKEIEGSLALCSILCERHESMCSFRADEYERLMHELERDGKWFRTLVEDVVEEKHFGLWSWRFWERKGVPRKYWFWLGLAEWEAIIWLGFGVIYLLTFRLIPYRAWDWREMLLSLGVMPALMYLGYSLVSFAGEVSRARFPAGKEKYQILAKAVSYVILAAVILLILAKRRFWGW